MNDKIETVKDILWIDRSVPWCGLHTRPSAVCKAWQISYGSTGSQQPEGEKTKRQRGNPLCISEEKWYGPTVIPGRAPLDCTWLKCCSEWPPPPPSASARSPACSSQAIWAFLRSKQNTNCSENTEQQTVDPNIMLCHQCYSKTTVSVSTLSTGIKILVTLVERYDLILGGSMHLLMTEYYKLHYFILLGVFFLPHVFLWLCSVSIYLFFYLIAGSFTLNILFLDKEI